MEKMKFFNSLDQINIPRSVLLLRQSRTGMVQTPEQYHYIYQVLKDAREELREKAPRVFAVPPSASPSMSSAPRGSLSSSENDYVDRTRQLCGLKRNFKELLHQRNPSQSCSSESILLEEEERKAKLPFRATIEKKRRLSFSTC